MASLANLVVTLAADTAAFTTGFDKASREGKRSLYKLEKDMVSSAKKLGVAFASAATSMAVIVKKTVDVADQMRDLSQATGISTEVLSGYAYAAEQSGASLESFTGGIRKMQKSIADAAGGMEKQSEAFLRLGLSASELLKMSPDKAFELIADRLSKMENATLKAATAQEIFGRGASGLLPLMNEGAAGIATMHQEAERFGRIIGTDFANNADVFNDNIGRLRAQLEGVAVQIVSTIIPAMSKWLDKLINSGSIMRATEAIGNGLVAMFKVMAAALEILTENATATIAALSGFATLKALPLFFAKAHPLIALTTAAVVGLAAAFIYFRNEAKQTERILADLEVSINDTTAAWIKAASATELMGRQAQIRRELADTDERLLEIQKRLARLMADAPDELEQYHAEIRSLREEEEKLVSARDKLTDSLIDIRKQLKETGSAASSAVDDFEDFSDTLGEVSVKAKKLEKDWTGYIKFALDKRQKQVNEVWEDSVRILDELISEMEAAETATKGMVDRLFPLEAATREYNKELSLLRREAQEAGWSTDRLADAERRLAKEFNDTRKQITGATDDLDLLSVAMEEGARIMERAFQGMWENLLSGADNTFDSILDGFKSLISQMIHEATTRKITLQIQQAFGEDGGGFSDLDFGGAFGQDLVSAIGAIAGQAVAGTDIGSFLSSLGAIGGKWLGEQLGWWLGAWGGPIGLAIGSVAGAIIGDWISGVFERDLRFSLGGENQRTLADNQTITTALGTILSPSAQGGFGSLNDPNSFGGQIAAALTQFDTGLADILGQFATDDQFTAVTDALEDWVGTWGETATVADVLSSRFNVILGQFSTDIQDFVRGAESFEEQIERFGVALATDKLIRENPEIFSGRAAGEILNLVAAMQSGSETMGEAFDQFLILLNRVVNVRNSLQSFAQSDLLSDYSALSGETSLADALAAVNQGIIDAITNFDGSIESLEEIGALAMIAREGELKLLAQIDAIQKGINANLDKLQADILGLSEPDKTGEQLFMDAQSLIGKIKPGMSAEEIADLERQFSGIISAIAPEDQLRMQSEILAIIELFRNAANAALNTQRNDVLGNAETVRDVVDVFLTEIGDPLSIIAGALEGRNIPEVMEDGLSEINTTVATIGPQVAQALQSGLAGVQFNVTLQSPGLVTQ